MKIVVLDANAFWTEQLFRQCGRFTDVLLLKPRDFRAHRRLCGTWKSNLKPQQVGERVWEQCFSMPPGWMFGLWPLACRKIQSAIRHFAGSEPLTLVLTYPQYRGLIVTLKPAQTLYYNFDDYRDNWPGHETQIPGWERELVGLADDTVCIANYRRSILREQHPTKASQIHHLPIGCSPEFMSPQSPPPELTGLARPIAGYIGALNRRFDYTFLADVARQLPEVTFALGGKPPAAADGDSAWETGLRCARSLPNVRFLGWVDHARLGEFLHSFDTLFMSYSRCNFNTNACPAKLWDYLGTGKPIVANDANPETLLWREIVHIGATPNEFAAAIQEVLKGEPVSFSARRLNIARAHTWEKLAARLQTILTSG